LPLAAFILFLFYTFASRISSDLKRENKIFTKIFAFTRNIFKKPENPIMPVLTINCFAQKNAETSPPRKRRFVSAFLTRVG
jgi:hypothetical protein